MRVPDGVNEWVRLVLGMNRPGRHQLAAARQSRDQYTLIMIAVLADEEGVARVSLSDLHAVMAEPMQLISASLRTWEKRGVLTRSREVHGPIVYRLVRDALAGFQLPDTGGADGPTVSLLMIEHLGVDTRAVNALGRGGVYTIHAFAKRVEAFRALPARQQADGFHVFLDIPSLGPGIAESLLAAYDRWVQDQE